MRRTLSLIVALLAGSSAPLLAQGGNIPIDGTMQARAQIIQPLRMSAQILDFGVIVRGNIKRIDFSFGHHNSRESIGLFHVQGDSRFDVRITATALDPLQKAESGHSLLTHIYYCTSDIADAEAALASCSDMSSAPEIFVGTSIDGGALATGHRRIFLAGTAEADVSLPSGQYSGRISMQAEYLGI